MRASIESLVIPIFYDRTARSLNDSNRFFLSLQVITVQPRNRVADKKCVFFVVCVPICICKCPAVTPTSPVSGVSKPSSDARKFPHDLEVSIRPAPNLRQAIHAWEYHMSHRYIADLRPFRASVALPPGCVRRTTTTLRV